jgi:molybdopterin-guanine dinucleotide biosynthesis protein A
MKPAGVIVAGGGATRMGGTTKAFLEIGGKTIVARIIARLEPQCAPLAINANVEAGHFAAFGLAVVPDLIATVGTPLAGIHASLAWAREQGCEAALTVPGDAPFLPRNLGELLVAAAKDGAAIAASGGRHHYLTGLWPTALLEKLDAELSQGCLFRVADWAALIGAGIAEWPATPFDPFFNVNTPEELAVARRIAAEFGA